MERLREFLNNMSPEEQAAFARRCGTSIGYLRKAISVGQTLGETLALNIERESAGSVPLCSIRQDLDETLAVSGYVLQRRKKPRARLAQEAA